MTSIAVALIVAAVQPGSASAAVQHTQEKVRSSLNAWFKSQGPARARAREQARKAVGELVDFDALARSTLGKKWEEIKPADRSRYTAALKGAMEANYLAKMRQGKGTTSSGSAPRSSARSSKVAIPSCTPKSTPARIRRRSIT